MVPLTPWVKRLLVMNGIVFLAVPLGGEFYYQLALFPATGHVLTHPWTLVTYQFLHGGLGHLFFNMLALFFFGPRLEERMGGTHFLSLYLLSGVGGALLSLGVPGPELRPIVGASGAVYGVLVAYAALWPRTVIHIWAVLPIEAWALALIMVLVSLWYGLTGSGGNVAHFAHLGGLAVGFAYLRIWEWRLGAARREFKRKLEAPVHREKAVAASFAGEGAALSRWEAIDTSSLHELNREEVELLLDKARTHGVKALSLSERQFLDRMVQA
ncbi:MAG TPA: rhomboid family intramembrane serine protease [Longimicrobiales bacterium]|nr:rhomboid family intramembrane serine protease [Longimicrobiales bacterium]